MARAPRTTAPSMAEKPPAITAARFRRLDLDPALRARKTTSDYIADALRAAIYDGQFADGEKLNQVELADYFKVSRVPIREALRRLQAEGLVSDAAHQRVVVIGLEPAEVLELIEIRAVLEGHLVSKAGPTLAAAELDRLKRLCDEMERIQDYNHDWVLKNWEFHRVIYGPSGARATIAMVEQLHLKAERYVRRAGRGARLRQAAAEHRGVLAAVERGDFAAAGGLMRAHILNSGEEVRLHFEEAQRRGAAAP